jgi:hypothetical protein
MDKEGGIYAVMAVAKCDRDVAKAALTAAGERVVGAVALAIAYDEVHRRMDEAEQGHVHVLGSLR